MIEVLRDILGSGLTPTGLLETEHGLVMILLLYSLLTYRGTQLFRLAPVVVAAGILLSIFTPVHQIDLFWPVLTGLVVPPMLWQAAVAVTKSGPLRRGWSLVIWGVMLLLVTFSLRMFSALPVSNALLLGILTVTLVWYFRELMVERSYLSTIGQVALAVLLVEIDLEVVSLQFWVGTLLSGVAVGLAVGFAGIALYRRLRLPQLKNWFFFGWAYLAYLTGLALGTSAIAVTLATALVVAAYGFSIGLWLRGTDIPLPSRTPLFFYLTAGVWILLGWQTHTSVDTGSLPGILAALVVITAGILVLRRVIPVSSGDNRWSHLLRKETGILLLLFGGILFWPRQALLTTISVEIALAASLLLIILLRELLKPLFEMMGIELSWPTDRDNLQV